MIFVKVKNAAELCWDSLDPQERMIVVYAGAWLVGMILVALRKRVHASFERANDELKRQLLEEIRGDSGKAESV